MERSGTFRKRNRMYVVLHICLIVYRSRMSIGRVKILCKIREEKTYKGQESLVTKYIDIIIV